MLIFSQLLFASPCPKLSLDQDKDGVTTKNCTSLEDVVSANEGITSNKDCKAYKDSNCFGFFEKSFNGFINGEARSDQKKNVNEIIKSKANGAISNILLTILSEGTKYDSKLSSLAACSLSELNNVPEGCKSKLEAMDLSPQKLSLNYTKGLTDQNDNNISCGLGINHYQSLMTMANEKELHKRFSDFFKSENGTELKKLIDESKNEDVNLIVKNYFTQLAPAQKLKYKSLITLVNNNPKSESLFSHKEDIDGFIAEGFTNKKFEDHYLAAMNDKCSKSFKAIKETVCGIKTEQDYTLSDPSLLQTKLNSESESKDNKLLITHMYCRTEQKINLDKLSAMTNKDAPSFSVFMDQKRIEIKNQMSDLCKIKVGCNDNSFNCWKSGCSKDDLSPTQKNYCELLGSKSGKDFQISSSEVIALLKDPTPESKDKNQSELLKYFLDPKPQINKYIAEAQKNEGENKKIAEHNSDDRGKIGQNLKNPSSQNQEIADHYPVKNNEQILNPNSTYNQNLNNSSSATNTGSHNLKKHESITNTNHSNTMTDETSELEGLRNARSELSNRIANTPTLPRTEKSSQKITSKKNEDSQQPVPTTTTASTNKEETKKSTKDEKPISNSQISGFKNKLNATNSPFSGDSTKDIASTIRRDLKKAEVNDKKISATIKLKHLYLDENHIQDIQKEIISTFGPELKNGCIFELTLEDINHTDKKVSLTFIPRPLNKNGHWEYEYDVTSLDDDSATLALLSHFNKSKLMIPFEVVEKKLSPNEKRARAEELHKNL